jgi:hypothetical protein
VSLVFGLFLLFLSTFDITIVPKSSRAMTKTQMQAVASAVTNAGFPATLIVEDGGITWRVRSAAGDFTVNVNAIKSLADAQGVSAFCAEAEYR